MTSNEVPDVKLTPKTQHLVEDVVRTANGQRLSPKEDRFITLYIKYSDPSKAAKEAGYSIRDSIIDKDRAYLSKGRKLLAKDYIQNEIAHRMNIFNSKNIADTEEILGYLTSVMRGEVKDAFGMDPSLADRTNAAKELNRRIHEIEHSAKVEGAKEVHLILERNY